MGREQPHPCSKMTEPRNLRPQEMFNGKSQRDTQPECRLRQDILALVVALDNEPLFINVNVRRGIAVTHFISFIRSCWLPVTYALGLIAHMLVTNLKAPTILGSLHSVGLHVGHIPVPLAVLTDIRASGHDANLAATGTNPFFTFIEAGLFIFLNLFITSLPYR